MGNPYPIAIIDESGVERLGGKATFTDPANQPGGAAPTLADVLAVGADADGSKITGLADGTNPQDAVTLAQLGVTTSGRYTGAKAVNNGAAAAIEWVFGAGDAVLDIAAPAAPAVVTAGTYAVSLTVTAGGVPTAGGGFIATLNAFGIALSAGALASAVIANPSVPLACCGPLSAGDVIDLQVYNADGVQALTFNLIARVTRIK